MVGQKTAAEVATDDVEIGTARFAYETHGGQGSRAQRERNVMASPLRLFRCEEWQEAAQSQLQPANAHGSKRRRTRKRMRPMAAAAMANMQHAPITCCSQVAR